MKSHDFDGIVLPGGFSPDKLRRDPQVKALIAECAVGRQAGGGDLPRRLDGDFGRRLSRACG